MNAEQDTFECEELNLVKVPDWGDSIFYAANRRPDALEEATRKAFRFVEDWKIIVRGGPKNERYSD